MRNKLPGVKKTGLIAAVSMFRQNKSWWNLIDRYAGNLLIRALLSRGGIVIGTDKTNRMWLQGIDCMDDGLVRAADGADQRGLFALYSLVHLEYVLPVMLYKTPWILP